MAELFWFSDEQWARIERLLPTNTRGLKRVDDRRVLSGIVHVLRSGCHWSHCPREYGPPKTIYNRFVRWAKRGIWERIFAMLSRCEDPPDRLMIDSTIVRAHRSSAGGKGGQHQAIGRSVGGRTTKIHLVTDAAGRPRVILLTPGNTNDFKPAQRCLELMPPAQYVIADKGYDSAPLRQWLQQRGSQPVIPPRRNRKLLFAYDEVFYRQRNIIERTINRIKDWRRIATRYDRHASVYLASLFIVATVTWWL
ncbi:MAG TPA: IS5 family transposase [Aestuariivirgaceae bacterium]|nr:IS5 family transposase [Aestuariivirgaceae bacterium]